MINETHQSDSVFKKEILNKIRVSRFISRADIAKETGISAPTVSKIVNGLLQEKLVVESKLGESSGGRKPTLLQLDETGYYVMGIDSGTRNIRGAIYSITGKIYHRTEAKVPDPVDKDTYLKVIIDVIYHLLENQTFKRSQLLGIGVGMHGIINSDKGIVYYTSNSGLKDVRVKAVLEEEFELPVIVENNSRALTLGEYWLGDYHDVERFTAINIGLGVGSGLIVRGQLIRGAHNVAGEIGHATISLEGDQCSCGRRGCLEMFVSGKAIARRAYQEISGTPSKITAEEVYERARGGDTAYLKILEDTAHYLSIGIINFIHTVNPNVIVLGGGVMKSADIFMPIIQTNLKQFTLIDQVWQNTVITVSQIGDDATLFGSAALHLRKIFM